MVSDSAAFGVSLYDVDVRRLVDVAVAAEAAGFRHLWLGEHLLLPTGYRSAHPTRSGDHRPHPRIVDPSTELLDPMVALAAVAAATTTIEIGTAVYLLPLRHPLVTARAAATLQQVAGGRFRLGVGAGWLEEEFEALEVPFADRGSRHEEALTVVRRALGGGSFDHAGRHYRFEGVQVTPRPVGVPIVMGGNSDRALRRAARLADGWFASGNPTLQEAVALKERLDRLASDQGRQVDCHVRMEAFEPGLISSYLSAGLSNLVLWAQHLSPQGSDPAAALMEAAERLGISPRRR